MSCPSNKMVYFTRSAAKHAARRVKSIGRGNLSADAPKKLLRPYKCSECGHFHLSSNVNYADARDYIQSTRQ